MSIKHNKINTGTIGFFNFARGCGLFYVVVCHTLLYFYTITSRLFFNLGAGLMAMFFIISGYGFWIKNTKKCLRVQCKLLLKPYFITVCLILLAKFGLSITKHRSFWQFGGQYIFSYLLAVNEGWEGTILGLEVDHISLFWFFWALFGGWIIYNTISHIKKEKIHTCLVICCVLMGWILTRISEVWVYTLPNMLIIVGFLFIGHQMREHQWLEKEKLTALEYLLLFVPAFITLAFGQCDMFSFTWSLGPLDILGSACLGILYCRFFAKLSLLKRKSKIMDFMQYIGSNTLRLLCIHAFEEKVVPWYRLGYLFPGKTYFAAIICFVLRGAVILISLKLIEFINKVIKRKRWRRSRLPIAVE